MKPTSHLLRLTLAASLAAGALAVPVLTGAPEGLGARAGAVLAEDDYESLIAEYEAAIAEYEKKLEEADRDERRELRKNRPVNAFWPRFTELAKTNDGRSLLWLAQNMAQYREIRSKDRAAALKPIFGALVEHHAKTAWFGDALASLEDHAETIGTEAFVGHIEAALERIEDKDIRAQAQYVAYKALRESDPKKSEAYAAALVEGNPGGYWGTKIRASKAKPSDSVVGKIAPDFTGRTIDGVEFQLEDFRGKVVMLDFYGFW